MFQKNLDLSQNKLQLEQAQMGMVYDDENKNITREQLDLSDEIRTIDNLLRGRFQMIDKHGFPRWVEPLNNDMKILSDYGINYIMNAIQWYLTKNTLLSNYDENQISAKMEDLATTITDDIFMEYDQMFLYPTLEDCKDELRKRILQKVETKKFALELMGKKADKKIIEEKVLKEMEDRIEKELTTIKEQKIKNKLKRFESIIRFIQDTIHSAYQRAWRGQERTTLRQHIHISENRNPNVQMPHSSDTSHFFRFKK